MCVYVYGGDVLIITDLIVCEFVCVCMCIYVCVCMHVCLRASLPGCCLKVSTVRHRHNELKSCIKNIDKV